MDADAINHAGGPPPYQQLATILRRQIASGELARRVPSERTLMQRYDLSQSTVRKALKLLEQEGLVRAHQGWGREIL